MYIMSRNIRDLKIQPAVMCRICNNKDELINRATKKKKKEDTQ